VDDAFPETNHEDKKNPTTEARGCCVVVLVNLMFIHHRPKVDLFSSYKGINTNSLVALKVF